MVQYKITGSLLILLSNIQTRATLFMQHVSIHNGLQQFNIIANLPTMKTISLSFTSTETCVGSYFHTAFPNLEFPLMLPYLSQNSLRLHGGAIFLVLNYIKFHTIY